MGSRKRSVSGLFFEMAKQTFFWTEIKYFKDPILLIFVDPYGLVLLLFLMGPLGVFNTIGTLKKKQNGHFLTRREEPRYILML